MATNWWVGMSTYRWQLQLPYHRRVRHGIGVHRRRLRHGQRAPLGPSGGRRGRGSRHRSRDGGGGSGGLLLRYVDMGAAGGYAP